MCERVDLKRKTKQHDKRPQRHNARVKQQSAERKILGRKERKEEKKRRDNWGRGVAIVV